MAPKPLSNTFQTPKNVLRMVLGPVRGLWPRTSPETLPKTLFRPWKSFRAGANSDPPLTKPFLKRLSEAGKRLKITAFFSWGLEANFKTTAFVPGAQKLALKGLVKGYRYDAENTTDGTTHKIQQWKSIKPATWKRSNFCLSERDSV